MKLTEYDYGYLKGNRTLWIVKGAAWNIVAEDCGHAGYGSFGKPTELGKKAMQDYEEMLCRMSYWVPKG